MGKNFSKTFISPLYCGFKKNIYKNFITVFKKIHSTYKTCHFIFQKSSVIVALHSTYTRALTFGEFVSGHRPVSG